MTDTQQQAYAGILNAQRGRDPRIAAEQWSTLTRAVLERATEDVIELTARLAGHFGRWVITEDVIEDRILASVERWAKAEPERCIFCNVDTVKEQDPYCSNICAILAREG